MILSKTIGEYEQKFPQKSFQQFFLPHKNNNNKNIPLIKNHVIMNKTREWQPTRSKSGGGMPTLFTL